MNKQYKSFYFLHIPKTGGRAFRENIIFQIYEDIKNKNITPIFSLLTLRENKIRDEAHGGWQNAIDDDTYIVTMFRDPIKQSVSLFAHIYDTKNSNMEARGLRVKDTDLSKVSKKDYLDWVIQNPIFQNLQFKNFLAPHSNTVYSDIEESLFYEKLSNTIKNKDHSIKSGFSRINRVNLMVDPDNLTNEVMEKMYHKICNDLDINPSQLEFVDTEVFRNSTSDYIYNQLSEDEKGILRRIFDLDYKVYDNKSLFTKF